MHVAPKADTLSRFLDRCAAVYGLRIEGRQGGHGKLDAILASFVAHHRLAWIHPFLDGNGRVARIAIDAMLRACGVNGAGLWSMSRGFAKTAGLLEHWQGPEGDVATFTLLTTEPNALMATIHDRMPVIIQPEYYGHWLDPGLTDNEDVRAMIGSHEAGAMEAYPVSRKVNSPANDGAELIAPIG